MLSVHVYHSIIFFSNLLCPLLAQSKREQIFGNDHTWVKLKKKEEEILIALTNENKTEPTTVNQSCKES